MIFDFIMSAFLFFVRNTRESTISLYIFMLYKRGVIKQILAEIQTTTQLNEISIYKSSTRTQGEIQNEETGNYPVYDASGVFTYINAFDIDVDYVAIIKDGSGVGRVQYCLAESSFIGTLGALLPNGCSAEFLMAILEHTDFTPYVTGAAIPHVYFKDYGNMSIPFPDMPLQKTISNIYRLFTQKISNSEKVLTELLNYKKSLLQQMFI